jgi:membrane protein implicated in regulation of membrane protease activity
VLGIDASLVIAFVAMLVLALLAAWLLWEARRRNH